MKTAVATFWWNDMTLGEALAFIREIEEQQWACACHGPPCCIDGYQHAKMVVRGAHIAVKQMHDLARRHLREP
jgi:hypothetical protein